MTLNGVTAVTLRYFTEFGKRAFQHNHVHLWRNLCTSLLYFVMHVRCRRKESSPSPTHLLMSFLLYLSTDSHGECCDQCVRAVCCVSRQHIHQQDSKLSELKEELVMLRESIHSTCLQKDVLHREKQQLGLWLSFTVLWPNITLRCLQKDVLHREKQQLGLWPTFTVLWPNSTLRCLQKDVLHREKQQLGLWPTFTCLLYTSDAADE